MPLEPELIDLMLDALVIENRTGVDKFNKPSYDSPASVRCQVVRMNVQTVNAAGEETVSTLQAILADPELEVDVNSRLTLSDGSHPDIIEVLSAKDDKGPYYLEIRA